MENAILIGGIGGQGVVMFGKILCYTAADVEGKFVTFYPSYGVEKRGGVSNCYVTISDDPIGAPKADDSNTVVALNDLAVKTFEKTLLPGGTFFIDSSVCELRPTRTDINVIEVPASEIAREIGNMKVANICMIGAFIGYSECLPPEKILETAFKMLGAKHPELNEVNEKAFFKGLEIGKAAK
ncbi:MAG: pyruvate ferredoxin oxidoreductase [Ruminococcaceae bacterium]|nr:pyruvate ferredoxin oxidoreductase [Oscillospiraceae bacterium]